MTTEDYIKELRDTNRELTAKVERHERYFWVALILLGVCGVTGGVLVSGLRDADKQIATLSKTAGDHLTEITAANAKAVTAIESMRAQAVTGIESAKGQALAAMGKYVESQDFLAKAREGTVKMNEDYYIRFSTGPWDLNLFGNDKREGGPVVVAGRNAGHRWRLEK